MIIFLHGQDNFRSLRQLAKIKKSFIQKKAGDIITIDSNDFKIGEFKNHLQTQGLFKSNKLIIVKNLLIEGEKIESTKINPLLQSMSSETSIVFYERGQVDKRSKLFKLLTKLSTLPGKLYYPEFKLFDSIEMRRWIINQLKKTNKMIEPSALNYLIDACADLWQASNEIGKLAVLSHKQITLDDVTALVLTKVDNNIFHLTDALGQKKMDQALKLLSDQLSAGAEPLYLLSMIARQIKILIKIKSAQSRLGNNAPAGQLAVTVREHPFVVQKTRPMTKLFSLNRLIDIHSLILKTDLKLKSSRLSPETLLSKLIYDIIEK